MTDRDAPITQVRFAAQSDVPALLVSVRAREAEWVDRSLTYDICAALARDFT
ncbi:MAG: hypothetical protein ACHQQP_04125 [Gemmatimonadales bacterium]